MPTAVLLTSEHRQISMEDFSAWSEEPKRLRPAMEKALRAARTKPACACKRHIKYVESQPAAVTEVARKRNQALSFCKVWVGTSMEAA